MKPLYSTFIALCIFTFANAQSDVTVTTPTPTSKVFTFVEENPQFPGGDAALMKFLQQNIHYPDLERDNDVQGKVLVRFVVNEDGSVTDVSVIRSVSPGLDNEAVRVVKKLPRFTPGKQQGKLVKVYFNLPIVFRLQENNTEQKLIEAKLQKDEYYKNAVNLGKDSKYKEALSQLKKSISKFPTEYLGYELLADFETKLGKHKEACEDYVKAKTYGSPNADAILRKNCQ